MFEVSKITTSVRVEQQRSCPRVEVRQLGCDNPGRTPR